MHKCAYRNACCFFFPLISFIYFFPEILCVCRIYLGTFIFPLSPLYLMGCLWHCHSFLLHSGSLFDLQWMSLTLIVRMAEECLYRRHCDLWEWYVLSPYSQHVHFEDGTVLNSRKVLYSVTILHSACFAGSPFFSSDFSPFLYFWNGFTLNFGPVWAGVLFWLLVDPSKFVLFPGSAVECCWMTCFLSLCAPVAFRQANILVVVMSSTSAYIYNACNFVPSCASSGQSSSQEGLRNASQVDCQGQTEENE